MHRLPSQMQNLSTLAFRLFGQIQLRLPLLICGVPVCRDLSSARMQLRGIVKQTEEKFSDTDAFAAAAAALQRIEQALQRLKGQS